MWATIALRISSKFNGGGDPAPKAEWPSGARARSPPVPLTARPNVSTSLAGFSHTVTGF
jgi:hypothetical protein